MDKITEKPVINFDKLTKFEQYMLIEDNIDIESIKMRTISDLRLVSEILSRYHIYVLIDLVTDMQFTLYKGYLSNLYGKEFTDEEVYSMASPAISKKLDYKSNILTIENLPLEYGYRASHDAALVRALKGKGVSVDLKELKKLFPNFKSMLYLTSEKSCIEGINLRSKLIKIGLEEYSKTIITRLVGEDAYLTLGKEAEEYDDNIKQEDLKFSFSLSKNKTPIKKLIKDYHKSTK